MKHKPRCVAVGEYGQCVSEAKYRIAVVTDKRTWEIDVCADCKDEEYKAWLDMIEHVYRQTILSEVCTPLYGGIAHEQARIKALFTENSRTITWKEASTLMRCCYWEPDVARERGVAVLYGGLERITSISRLRTMTPAQFWQRLRQIDAERVAEAERRFA